MLKFVARIAALAALCLAALPAQAQNDKVRISFNPQIYSYMPVFLAMDKGYFLAEKLDIEFSTYGGSALSQIPMLARGDQDIAGMVTGPGFFNQHAEGFGIKLVAAIGESRDGWHDTMWVMVRKELMDAGKVKGFADFKGLNIEGGPKGSPIFLVSTQAIRQGGLTLKDVTFTERLRSVSDVLPLFRNKAIDIITMVEPVASRLESEGLAVRWKPAYSVLPNYQGTFLAASPKFLGEKREITKRFLRATIRGMQDVHASGGKWTPDMIAALKKYAKITDDVIEKIPGPQAAGNFGKIELGPIEREQNVWLGEGIVKIKTPLADLIDSTMVDEVRADMGIK